MRPPSASKAAYTRCPGSIPDAYSKGVNCRRKDILSISPPDTPGEAIPIHNMHGGSLNNRAVTRVYFSHQHWHKPCDQGAYSSQHRCSRGTRQNLAIRPQN
ncbi:hypothetical protein EMCG_01164 [[Emmonsia] crescens]|uniref:Uncharacterized protein n=1 Tax=[Emmonsia] crescens TaxID=73230 RepID=A0A0G2I6M6_9EURO|nr:hypothetical protein EMCG_01164 [Emmonsia crescens UAMH 3008]